MSTLAYLTDGDLAAGVTLTDTVALEVFWQNPAAVLDLIYGPDRRISGAAPAHDHDEDGGEPHHLPIFQHSFGRFYQDLLIHGLPLGPPGSESFAITTTNGIVDYTPAKRMHCAGIRIPGGVSQLRVSLTEYHETAALPVTLYVAFRLLASVNYRLGVAADEVRGEITYTTVGTAVMTNQSITIDDLTNLGDPTRDREVEVSLWLACDLDVSNEHRILDWEVLAIAHTAAAREATPADLPHPLLSVRELKGGMGMLSPQFGAKVREVYNGLNRGLWGSTPGLLSDLQPDRRRRYQETIEAPHQHQGALTPQADLSIIGDGACLADTQSFAYTSTDDIDSSTNPPPLERYPFAAVLLGFSGALANQWRQFNFRRSIPAGCGALLLRVAVQPGQSFALASDATKQLLMSLTATPVGGGSDIVTRILCGANASPINALDDDFGFCRLDAEENVGYLSNAALQAAGREAWNMSAEISRAEQTALQLTPTLVGSDGSYLYRVSQPIRVQLTYPPERASETYHATQDYDVKIRFKRRDSSGSLMDDARLLWIMCSTAPGY
jgi:hypothetical protein